MQSDISCERFVGDLTKDKEQRNVSRDNERVDVVDQDSEMTIVFIGKGVDTFHGMAQVSRGYPVSASMNNTIHKIKG